MMHTYKNENTNQWFKYLSINDFFNKKIFLFILETLTASHLLGKI